MFLDGVYISIFLCVFQKRGLLLAKLYKESGFRLSLGNHQLIRGKKRNLKGKHQDDSDDDGGVDFQKGSECEREFGVNTIKIKTETVWGR